MMKQIKFIQPQYEMVIVGVSIDLTTHADVPTRVRNAVVAHTRPSGASAGVVPGGGHFVISSSSARAGAITGKHAVPPRQKSRAGPYAVAPGHFAGAPSVIVMLSMLSWWGGRRRKIPNLKAREAAQLQCYATTY
jgi:hypothetical protein